MSFVRLYVSFLNFLKLKSVKHGYYLTDNLNLIEDLLIDQSILTCPCLYNTSYYLLDNLNLIENLLIDIPILTCITNTIYDF